ncbi:hypothetical protein FE257_012103 [Aspergillus nanangensis]|uniref:Amidohydrolase-related domain-containing protein n=1 Tax=Aspergillus nanangensis TaxID=2582783 RepID=A0AAD4GR10_ASPNN|nr:hypothetical protein FE257_012103 [Aspergillus nanangensis]
MPVPIIDSHIHLFPESHLPTLAWHGPGNPLASQHSLDEYRIAAATALEATQPTYLRGFIFLETDRISSVEESGEKGWNHALDEVSLLTRIISGEPITGEGHHEGDRHLCLGVVPWAPVPGGAAALRKYMALVKERTKSEEIWKKIRGVRYLVQDKPSGVMLQPEFIDGLKWLGTQCLAFDLGVDARQGGVGQLREAVEMMRRLYEEEKSDLTIVINHLCKPNLRLPYHGPESITGHADFLEWKTLITAMARYPTTYMKLSGAFSEFLPLPSSQEPDIASLVESVSPWTDIVFDAFGPERVMFGSDWPVCNVGGGGNGVSWGRWQRIVEGILQRRGLDEDQKRGVWGQVAVNAYGIEF